MYIIALFPNKASPCVFFAEVSGDTLQLKDYGKTDWPWSLFDPEEKKRRHETVFPEECRRAFSMGEKLAMQSGVTHNHRM